jgi:hypothetical protein
MKKQKNENSTVFNVSSDKLVANVIQMLDSNPATKTDMAFSARDIWTEALPILLSKLPQSTMSTMIIVYIVESLTCIRPQDFPPGSLLIDLGLNFDSVLMIAAVTFGFIWYWQEIFFMVSP